MWYMQRALVQHVAANDSKWFEIPICMRNGSLKHAVNLGYNSKLCNDLKHHNGMDKNKYIEAKNENRC